MKQLKISPHALTAMKNERDSYQNIANRFKAGTLDRFMADQRLAQLDAQIARIEDRVDPDPTIVKEQPKAFLPTCAACGQINNGTVAEVDPCPACGQQLRKTLHLKKERAA
jgi:predicted RNA-binding Zn-ribbon protein involved in translation (DUF1610 family)